MGDIFGIDHDEPEQKRVKTHYMVSPHPHTQNFFNNTIGSNLEARVQKTGSIVPVFKDEQQRAAFHQRATDELATNQKYVKALQHSKYSGPEWDSTKAFYTPERGTVISQMIASSHSGSAKFNLQGIDEESDVIVQGHGSPGKKRITSDNPDEKAVTRKQTHKQVAALLHSMKLPDANQVRTNSCHSAAAHYVQTDEPDIVKHFQQNVADEHHGGDWHKTFAGGLEEELVKLNHHNSVRGYLGATSQAPGLATDQSGKQVKRLNVGIIKAGTGFDTGVDKVKVRFEKSGMSKINPATKATVSTVANIQSQGLANADRFRAKLLAAHGRHAKGTHAVQTMSKPAPLPANDNSKQRAIGKQVFKQAAAKGKLTTQLANHPMLKGK
ncbi:hypothetical protein [Aliikangiella coralliicola]|uniref:Uncharacterized protein n=1 Tax=Aliikangiella coralliicola TaxID=2592383 RepID=A0A545UCR8_9GAMM|nr:hypothetical protein [Aliikangiella coralliicola]TQV87256.1 hypothetical protein FLL46_12440 [Aliikangiella coralliicola]